MQLTSLSVCGYHLSNVFMNNYVKAVGLNIATIFDVFRQQTGIKLECPSADFHMIDHLFCVTFLHSFRLSAKNASWAIHFLPAITNFWQRRSTAHIWCSMHETSSTETLDKCSTAHVFSILET